MATNDKEERIKLYMIAHVITQEKELLIYGPSVVPRIVLWGLCRS